MIALEEDRNERHLTDLLKQKREILQQAPALYGRPLSPDEYWWLGVGLSAWTLADQGGKPYAADRLEALMDRLGRSGADAEWMEQLVNELALLNAEGLLWPRYQRSETGQMEPTGVPVYSGFGPREGYYLALGHIGVAVALYRDETEWLPRLTDAIGNIVECGLTEADERVILEFFASQEADD